MKSENLRLQASIYKMARGGLEIEMGAIERLMEGSIDMHVHSGPDSRIERRLDALQAARQAEEAGMRAIVLKSHEYPTAPLAYIVGQMAPKVSVFGSLALDTDVGGLNPAAVEVSAVLGAKVLWMPTLTSANDRRKLGFGEGGLTIFDEKGNILPVVGEILDLVKAHDMVLASGHLSIEETYALVEEARKKGIWKMVVTHPLNKRVGATLSVEQQKELAGKGAFMEYCFHITMPLSERLDPRTLAEVIRAVGVERCILDTDFGQAQSPAPAEGMRLAIAVMLRAGLTEKELEVLVKSNPAKLLGLAEM